MEFYIFFGLLIIGAVVLLFRSRRGTTSWRESPKAGQPYDRTDQIAFPTDAEYDGAKLAAMRSRPVSREEGHGKDGSG
jgi:hypothetical protein